MEKRKKGWKGEGPVWRDLWFIGKAGEELFLLLLVLLQNLHFLAA